MRSRPVGGERRSSHERGTIVPVRSRRRFRASVAPVQRSAASRLAAAKRGGVGREARAGDSAHQHRPGRDSVDGCRAAAQATPAARSSGGVGAVFAAGAGPAPGEEIVAERGWRAFEAGRRVFGRATASRRRRGAGRGLRPIGRRCDGDGAAGTAYRRSRLRAGRPRRHEGD